MKKYKILSALLIGAGLLAAVPQASSALQQEPSCTGSATLTPIFTIQGGGSSAALTGAHTTEGIVVGDFQSDNNTGLQGFYLQDRAGDADPNTSDAIFIDESATSPDSSVSVGDYVRISGTVSEQNTLTRIQPSSVQLCGKTALPAPTKIAYPLPNGQSDLEKFEGMLLEIAAPMTVTEHFQLGRFGEVLLASGGSNNQAGTDNRLDQYTQFFAPSKDGLAAYKAESAKRTLLLDDGRGDQNPPVNVHGRTGGTLQATDAKTLRGGDVVSNLIGVLDYRFNVYRIQPTQAVQFQPSSASARPALPLSPPSGIRVSSFNVLNYFVTLNASGNNFNNPCGNALAARGANTNAEFVRQKEKTVAAIRALGSDILGLTEIQNNGAGAGSAIVDLVSALNAGQLESEHYAVIADPVAPEFAGCDAIKVAFIYKPSRVTPVAKALSTSTVAGVTVALGAAFTVPDGFGEAAFNTNNRKPIAVTFQTVGSNEVFTAVINHFKSKSAGAGGSGDTDAIDGQGAFNGTRLRAAKDLKAWLATNPTGSSDPDVLVMGDLNAYAQEDPIRELAPEYTSALPSSAYSYVFSGEWGSLDHILHSKSLSSQIVAARSMTLNADEPNILDYNIQLDNGTVIKSAAQQNELYAADAFRSSDHDPIVLDLNLGK